MHIVHLETGRHVYGGARQVLMLLEGLAGEGVRSTLVCPEDSAIATSADPAFAEVVTLPMAGDLDLRFASRFSEWLAGADADLVHVHSRRGADVWGGLARRPAGVPAVLTRRVDNAATPVLGALKYRLYDRIIAISSAIGAQVVADGAPEDRLRIVRSAVDAAACQPLWSVEQFRSAFACADATAVAACVAQLIPRKGHHDLLSAWADVQQQCPDAHLVLFGQGKEEAALREQVTQAGLTERVHFAGFRDDLRDFIGCADLLVHPALREGLGICLLEAQAAGVPVVTTRAGGIPEAVHDGVSAMLVEPGDVAALAESVNQLLNDAPLRAAMGTAGREFIDSKFSPAAMVSGNLSVYRELLN